MNKYHMVSSNNPFTEAMRRWWFCEKCKKFNEITLENYLINFKFQCKCGKLKEINLVDLLDKDQVTEKGGQL